MLILVWLGAPLVGCTLGPKQIKQGRLHYNRAVQSTFQEEMLLNLVRLKYREIPEFLKVGGIAAQYSFDGSASTGLTVPEAALDTFSASGRVARSEKPTISYLPGLGTDFQQGLLAPIDLQSILLLARTGWSWDRILRTTVQYANEVDNATSAGGPTPQFKPEFEDFRFLAKNLRELQTRHHVEFAVLSRDVAPKRVPLAATQLDGRFVLDAMGEGYSFEERNDGLYLKQSESYTALVVHPEAKRSPEMAAIADLLDLQVSTGSAAPASFELKLAKAGRIASSFAGEEHRDTREDIVMSTRSLLETMFYLSQAIRVPQEHQMAGLVTLTTDHEGNPFDWTEMTGDLLYVCYSKKRPKTAAVAVKFKDYWFYIDDRDLNSQSTFALLIELFGIEVQAGGGGGFLYTLNVGG